ncbi:hypothetical protein JHN55_07065 [Streptomyces sp. MBT56]|uniref:hypothetical protein n=1 Tax=unclassified Streptomyces TaxID=2593676 RepID=UPI00190C7AF9|nr:MULTISPECIES: hypothetical protein [unclassified Streptomyces]MBK3556299.1 hypothetical protein [Streptomyces sp. MBT56]MBK3601235.1 hypothetical protein [Streptomyces sp. MBT54]MBK3614529.1 hypothetical protein [Streptomyces sp. MBT98]MBK6042826.1 hypothetical protein [Streptomyces sp. MBT55]
MPYDLGATARLTAECRDPGGALTTAATAVVTVALPDGTTATPAAAEGDTGIYQADYTTTESGRHEVRWVWTDPAHAYTDVFDVRDAAPPVILSLADAKDHLNQKTAVDNNEVRFWNEATTRCVEHFTGPVIPRTFTEMHRERQQSSLVLLRTPVIAVTAVEQLRPGGPAYDAGDLLVNEDTGRVSLAAGGYLRGPLRFTYTAGRTTVAANIQGAARIILQHLWRTQLAQGRGGIAGGTDYSVTEPIPGLGYAIPNRAVQLLEPDRLPPGSA